MTAKKSGPRKAKKAAKGARKRGRKTSSSAPQTSASSTKANFRAASNTELPDNARVEAIAKLTNAVIDDDATFRWMLDLLRDTNASLPVRLAALGAIQAASFSALAFSARRPAYLAALRSVVDDPELEMRQRALGLLSREGDRKAQDVLLRGLKDPSKALVPPEKALQLIGYDPKAEAYPIARQILRQPPNEDAKREALRLLAADAKSANVFEKILLDRAEPTDVRQIAASALQTLAPDTLQEHARRIVLDTDENPEVQATSLTAITQFGKAEKLIGDDVLGKRVEKLQAEPSESVQQSAAQFMSKYR
jgi:HEAT repeat protein